MPLALVVILAALGLFVLFVIVHIRLAGPPKLPERVLARALVVQKSTADRPEPGWTGLGDKTTADGLQLRFEHDDDPAAEASYLVEGTKEAGRATLANRITVRLGPEFETHHVHTRGYVFRVRLRGTGPVIGKEVKVQMHVHSDRTPHCGRVENDDDTDAAVGGWIEFESVEVLKLGRA